MPQDSDLTHAVIDHEISGVDFGWFTPEEIRKLSVKQITEPETFDTLDLPVTGGLHDRSLGPMKNLGSCDTCNLDCNRCPGHVGHIELDFPLYNTMLFPTLIRLLRMTCERCHHWRFKKHLVDLYVKKLKLVDRGQVVKAMNLAMKVNMKDVEADQLFNEADKHTFGKAVEEESHSAEQRQLHRMKIMQEFLKLPIPVTCSRCDLANRSIKRDGYQKLVYMPLSSRQQIKNDKVAMLQQMPGGGKKSRSSSKDDADVDDDEDDEDEEAYVSETEAPTDTAPETGAESSGGAASSGDSFRRRNERRAKAREDMALGKTVVPNDVIEDLKLFWTEEWQSLDLLWGLVDAKLGRQVGKQLRKYRNWEMFFITTIIVAPTRYRPPNFVGGMQMENTQNNSLKGIINKNLQMRQLANDAKALLAPPHPDEIGGANDRRGGGYMIDEDDDESKEDLQSLMRQRRAKYDKVQQEIRTLWFDLQRDYNSLIDSRLGGSDAAIAGIKQLLEKKEGLLRKHMMGKRVNYAARSVISPDLWIHSTEIGVPVQFAKALTYAEPANAFNYKRLRQNIINGPKVHPGANAVEIQPGVKRQLDRMSKSERVAVADALLTRKSASEGFKQRVYRHLKDGDFVIMNRQPTLHKPSMMTHKVRVLDKSQVIRLHYANCASYNADYDGDEINLHFPQNELARAEAMFLSNTSRQYVTPKDGSPLRGLMQDHVCGGTLMTKRDAFFSKGEYMQYVCAALFRDTDEETARIEILPPAVIKPEPLWTGKQILSTILMTISGSQPKLNLLAKSQTPLRAWDSYPGDKLLGTVTIRNGQWLTGSCDKKIIGAKAHGLVHAVNEMYGADASDDLLTKFGRCFTTYVQNRGFSAGISDLILVESAEEARTALKTEVNKGSVGVGAEYVGIEDYSRAKYSDDDVAKSVQEKLRAAKNEIEIDNLMKEFVSPITSSIIEEAFPGGLKVKFPENFFATMILTGGKGSLVNISQIVSLLGQQSLEGKRVPRMSSGKTLPSFAPYDMSARAGGYIADRFITGIRPQEYYFHCMAGREGLVDTAVKTSRSGYLQRCLVKHLEGLTVGYDHSVRDCDGSLIQFLYGEDAIDTTRTAYLNEFKFVADNIDGYRSVLRPGECSFLDTDSARAYSKKQRKALQKLGVAEDSGDAKAVARAAKKFKKYQNPVMHEYSPSRHLGSVSENFDKSLEDFLAKYSADKDAELNDRGFERVTFSLLAYLKYLTSLVHPGESVGVVAAQSIGEPSTQMTLNTFHLAGHGGANVTLGIPRLREIVMTASHSIKTPTMSFRLKDALWDQQAAQLLADRLKVLTLAETLHLIRCTEFETDRDRVYSVRFFFSKIPGHVSWKKIRKVVESRLLPRLFSDVQKAMDAETSDMNITGKRDKQTRKLESAEDREEANVGEDLDGGDTDNESDAYDSDQSDDSDEEDKKLSANDPDADDSDSSSGADTDEELVDSFLGDDVEKKHDGADADSSSRRRSRKRKSTPNVLTNFQHEYFGGLRYGRSSSKKCRYAEIDIAVPKDARNLIVLPLAKQAAERTRVHFVKGIKRTFVLEESDQDKRKLPEDKFSQIQTDGVNFTAMWQRQDEIDVDTLKSNDIAAIYRTYGIEACRMAIIREIKDVFGCYGITVDQRHLTLIADTMTWTGEYLGFNRGAMKNKSSPLLRMSFESCTNFLQEACLLSDRDELQSPSSRLVFGQVAKSGTGSFKLLHRVVERSLDGVDPSSVKSEETLGSQAKSPKKSKRRKSSKMRNHNGVLECGESPVVKSEAERIRRKKKRRSKQTE